MWIVEKVKFWVLKGFNERSPVLRIKARGLFLVSSPLAIPKQTLNEDCEVGFRFVMIIYVWVC